VLAFLPNVDGVTYIPHGATTPATAPVALNAVTKTFDLVAKRFASAVAIVDADKCNKCHDALGTTFHTADRGGNVVACRLCHTTLNGGSHLEMQSRSIDSYVHAIHAMQPFDIGDVNFDVTTDAGKVAAMRYEHHIASTYPNFTLLNCESCHYEGTYDVPDQSKSLPGVLSAADAVTTGDRAIGAVPSYVTGPASRACGSCHRTQVINEDNAGALTALNEHTATFGTLIEAGTGVLDATIKSLMALFQ
jgi:OmcA/MtrC family decaheme c-type cytochrome